ncbi:MAG TPA: DUF1499 domain-containing protein [Usitatibacter sp.]|jgi:uncharacterized protein (DUF1499 family)|nr:DUF1499 domain-containing protein [Usitatibacter sp.]
MKRMTHGLARGLTLAAAVIAVALLVASGPGTKAGWWPWQFGLTLFVAAAWVGIAAAVAALLLLALSALPRLRRHPALPLVALCLALAAVAPPLIFRAKAQHVPPIHDITTDTQDPPQFVALRAEREKAPNGAAYGGPAIAAKQVAAYPEIKPLLVATAPVEELQRAIDAARAMGWEVVASDAAAGRIEATARTGWFGFKDDIVVRIRPEGAGSRVDVRSVSRVGRSDVGANAARVKEYLGRLA